jgi:guanylate kinase
MQQGILLVISAPSGAGKRTIIDALRRGRPDIETTISATTRAPRVGEIDGQDYYFLDRTEFERRRDVGRFVEWAEVHGNLYGTLEEELDRCLGRGADVLLELDVQGMRALRQLRRDAVSVFLMPPSLDELERRLRSRGTDREADIRLRLANARSEVAANREFDYIVINDEVERAAADLAAILRAEHCRPFRHVDSLPNRS